MIARHTHPGVESAYVIEGGTELSSDGVGRLTLKAGDGYQVPAGAPHGGKNGPLYQDSLIRTHTPNRAFRWR